MVPCFVQDKTNTENNPPIFRAKPPTVLQKQPFVPQKPAKRVTSKTCCALYSYDTSLFYCSESFKFLTVDLLQFSFQLAELIV